MREREVHPTIFIEIECDGAGSSGGHGRRPWTGRMKLTLARIQKHGWRLLPSRDDEIDRAVIVDIASDGGNGCCWASQGGLFCPFGERVVAIVAPQNVSGRRGILRKCKWLRGMRQWEIVKARDVQVEVAVVVVVDECHAEDQALGLNPNLIGYVLESAVTFVVKKVDVTIDSHREIGMAIVIVVADGATGAFAIEFKLRGLRDVLKFSVSKIVIERDETAAII